MTGLYDDSQMPYNNHYKASKQYSKVLFRPGRPAFSQELLEMESINNHQLGMLGDTLFQEGSIISGMELIPKPVSTSGTASHPNNFSINSIDVTNAQVGTTHYVASGQLDFTSRANSSNQYSGFDFTATATKGLGMTISFTLTRVSGTLNKVNLVYNKDANQLSFKGWSIDNSAIANDIDDLASATQLVTVDGAKVNLNDGNSHKVVVKFDTAVSGIVNLSMYPNAGYDLESAPLGVTIGGMYVEDGYNATSWVINPNDTTTASSTDRVKGYTVKDGRIWLAGAVREFKQQDISIKGVGTEKIGVRVDESVVTSSEDSDLLDNTPNAVTNGQAGADRIKYTVVLTYNDDSATTLFTFKDNVINQTAVKSDYSKLMPILARRTYDQSGSFLTSGFMGHMHPNPDPSKGAQDPNDSSKLLLDIDAGQAYVLGYSISTSSTTTLKLDVADETSTALNEGHYYDSTVSQYSLINQPVKSVSSVTYTAEKTVTYSSPTGGGNIDRFTNDNVVYIKSINGYTLGRDYTYSGNQIYWGINAETGAKLPNANVRPSGASYTVVYNYSVNASQGTDYTLVNNNGNTAIKFTNSGVKPLGGSTFVVTYSYYTARIDMIRITADQSNPFKVVRGIPATLSAVTPPIVNDPYTLELGYVLIMPNSNQAIFNMQTVTRITFDTLQQWGTRLSNTEYNLALAQMNEDVKRSEDPEYMKDVFSDGFTTINNRDDAKTTVAYDFENGEILLPSQAKADLTPTLNYDASNVAVKGHLVTPPYSEESAVSQNLATGTVNVNEFNIFTTNGTLEITPSSDNWIDSKSTTTFSTVNTGHVTLNKWWWHFDNNWSAQYMADSQYQYSALQGINWQANNLGEQQGYMLSDGGSTTTETAIEYMRSKEITFHAKNLRALSDNYKITIDGVAVQSPTPLNANYRGSKTDTFKADVNGEIKGTFVIPGGTIRCGTRTVKLVNESGDTATAQYTAQGTLKTVTNTIEKRVTSVTIVDPLAESFTLQETRQLSSVDLYFKAKASTSDTSHRSDLIVQIRELSEDGYPNRTIRAETTLSPDQIKISNDATVGTRIVFPDAVTLEANRGYAVVLISDSNAYEVFMATKGSTVIASGSNETVYNSNPDAVSNKDPNATGNNVVIRQTVSANVGDTLNSAPNANGVMFVSNNAQTWSAEPASSLKFRVNVCNFQNEGVVEFDPIILANLESSSDSVWVDDLGDNLDGKSKTSNGKLSALDRLVALTSYLTYQNTSLHWYIRLVQSSDLTSSAMGGNVEAILKNKPYMPLTVNNDNKAVATVKSETNGVPVITSNATPQSVNGELNMFQNTLAIQLQARFNSDKYVAPILTTEDLSLVAILTGKSADYESINVDESDDAQYNKVKLVYDVYLPAVGIDSPTVTPMYSTDGGSTWYNFPANGGKSITINKDSKKDSVPTSSKTVSSYFVRQTYEATVPFAVDSNHLADQFKVRLHMTSPNNFRTPRVRKLKVVLKKDL